MQPGRQHGQQLVAVERLPISVHRKAPIGVPAVLEVTGVVISASGYGPGS
jgi:hypothetical protein